MVGNVKNLIKLRKFSLICLVLSIPLSFIGTILHIGVLAITGTILLGVFIAISLLFWKCPYCRKRLPIRFNSNEDIDDNYSCPYCNGKF